MTYTFNTYIDDESMKEKLLSYDWQILKDTWTDCTQSIYNKIKNDSVKDYFLGNNPRYNKKNQSQLKKS